MIPTVVLRAARIGFGLSRGSVRLLSTRFGKICLAHHVPGGERTQVRLVREQSDTRAALTAEASWRSHLADAHGIRVPRPLQWRDGTAVSPMLRSTDGERWRAVASTWIPGAHLDRGLRAHQCLEVGALLAAMHNAGGDAPDAIAAARPTWGIPRLFELATSLRDLVAGTAPPRPDLSLSLVAALRQAHDALASAWNALPDDAEHVGLIHTDSHWQNIRWANGRPGLVDFEDFANGRYLIDLACYFGRIEHRPGSESLLRAMLDGYHRVRPLPRDAMHDLQVMLAFRRLDYAGWVLSWPRLDRYGWGPEALAGTPAYIDRTLSSRRSVRW